MIASSRSLAILTLTVERRKHLVEDSNGDVRASSHIAVVRSKIHCVDLGWERKVQAERRAGRAFEGRYTYQWRAIGVGERSSRPSVIAKKAKAHTRPIENQNSHDCSKIV